MTAQTFILAPAPHPARKNCLRYIQEAPEGWLVEIREPTRTSAQNALMWVVLQQLTGIDWYGSHLTREEWKDVITASLKRQKVVPGLDGGFVICGQSTSRMSGKEISDVIEVAYKIGAERGVKFKTQEAA